MNKYVLTAMLCPFMTATGQAQAPQDPSGPPNPSRIIVGGYQPAQTDTPLVLDAKAFVQKHLASMNLNEVTEAYTQVVAGLNVKLVCEVMADDGPSFWEFVAYRSLDSKWHFYSANRI